VKKEEGGKGKKGGKGGDKKKEKAPAEVKVPFT